jgi:hypothetical protein
MNRLYRVIGHSVTHLPEFELNLLTEKYRIFQQNVLKPDSQSVK